MCVHVHVLTCEVSSTLLLRKFKELALFILKHTKKQNKKIITDLSVRTIKNESLRVNS